MSEPVKSIQTPIRLEYGYDAGRAASRFLHGLAEGRILGQRCPGCRKVYVPPRGACPRCAIPTEDEVQVRDTGTVTTFSIVRVPSENLSVPLPFACAHVLLDGADIPFYHVIQECPLEEIRMGMRVRAVWAPRDELRPTLESIRHFAPLDEPDAPFESFQEHL